MLGNLFANGPSADACGFADGLRRLPAHNLPYNSLWPCRVRRPLLGMFIRFSLGSEFSSNLSFLGQNRMDNLLKSSHLERKHRQRKGLGKCLRAYALMRPLVDIVL
jgi:hypothetical protein